MAVSSPPWRLFAPASWRGIPAAQLCNLAGAASACAVAELAFRGETLSFKALCLLLCLFGGFHHLVHFPVPLWVF